MPRYDFICEKCGSSDTRIVPIKDRNKQKCTARLNVAHGPELQDIERGIPCKGKMARKEEISTTGRMTCQWAGWAD